MSYSSGVFSLVAGNPVVTGTTISSTWANNTLNDIATGLSTCLLKDGTQTATAAVPLANGLSVCPTIIGGAAAGSSLTLQSTSGVGTTDFIKFTVGSNGGTEVARINSVATGGNFCVGAAASTGGERVRIFRTNNADGLQVDNSSGSYSSRLVNLNMTGIAGGTGYTLITGQDSGGTVINIFGNGNITNTNNSYGAISDAKIKDVIGDSGSQWDDVKALAGQMKKFTLKADPNKVVQLGLVAQDAQTISPGLVFSVPDYVDVTAQEQVADPSLNILNADGGVLVAGTKTVDTITQEATGETLGVAYSVLYLKAVKALGEALVRIEALEAKVGI